mmetsp:Transcript_15356/g.43956  ORF Transcript_15356/g.43956 Transcript_15356/m.43956 type:complete len:336 (+) Transcript_15356:231-1238(+)
MAERQRRLGHLLADKVDVRADAEALGSLHGLRRQELGYHAPVQLQLDAVEVLQAVKVIRAEAGVAEPFQWLDQLLILVGLVVASKSLDRCHSLLIRDALSWIPAAPIRFIKALHQDDKVLLLIPSTSVLPVGHHAPRHSQLAFQQRRLSWRDLLDHLSVEAILFPWGAHVTGVDGALGHVALLSPTTCWSDPDEGALAGHAHILRLWQQLLPHSGRRHGQSTVCRKPGCRERARRFWPLRHAPRGRLRTLVLNVANPLEQPAQPNLLAVNEHPALLLLDPCSDGKHDAQPLGALDHDTRTLHSLLLMVHSECLSFRGSLGPDRDTIMQHLPQPQL